jgi:type II secretory pathway pseudopilin PulG
MSRKYVILILIGIVALLLVVLAIKWVYKPAKKSVESEKAVAEVAASALISDFGADEQKANEAYLGKVILVSGMIESITEDSAMITVTLKSPNDLSGVICSFSKTTVSTTAFHIGQQIKVKGKCDGYLMDVVLTKCSLVK